MTVMDLLEVVITDSVVIVSNEGNILIDYEGKDVIKECKHYLSREIVCAVPLNNAIEISLK